MTSEDGWRRQVAACAVLLAVVALRWHSALLDPRLAVDESDYTNAFAAVAAGGDPYDVGRFLYPPPFALAGAAAERVLGERGVVLLLRAANLLGAVALIWISLGWSRLSWRVRLVAGSALVAFWAPVHQSVEYGNITLAVLGAAFAALAVLPAQPLAAGAALGLGLAVKPLAPAIVALLPAWRPDPDQTPNRRAPWVAALAAAATLGLLLLWGGALLPRMLERTSQRLPDARSLSLGRLLQCLGIETTPLLLLALAVAAGAVLLRLRPRSVAELAVLASTAALCASPLVWTHTLALSLPAQVLALERTAAARRSAPDGSAERRRQGLWLATLAACALAIQGSEALVAIDDRPPLIQALFLAAPVLAPALFAWVALRQPQRGSGSAEPVTKRVPSANGTTVGQ